MHPLQTPEDGEQVLQKLTELLQQRPPLHALLQQALLEEQVEPREVHRGVYVYVYEEYEEYE